MRRGWVGQWEAGERPLPPADPVLRYGRPLLLPLSSVVCVRTRQLVLALTYDDGPDPDHTPPVLEALARHGAAATFFVLADNAEAHPGVVREILAAGHEVGLHGEDHTRLTDLPAREALRRVARGRRRLERQLGRPVRLFRPAYGAQSVVQYAGTRMLGMQVVIWSGWCRDWEGGDAPAAARRALGAVHPGAFLLLHDRHGDRDPALPPDPLDRGEVTRRLLDGLAAAGYRTATAGDLLARHPAIRSVWAERGSSMA